MYTQDDLKLFIDDILSILNKNDNISSDGKVAKILGLTPDQWLVIFGLATNLFEVTSVLINKDKSIEIVITGSLNSNSSDGSKPKIK